MSPEAYRTEVASAADEIRSTPEFDLRPSWDLEAAGVPEAWAHLEAARGEDKPGSGVTVGVIDTGIDLGHPSFDEAVAAGEITEEFFQGAADGTGEEFSHGTAVASVIAGRPSPTHGTVYTGIAPHAGLGMFAIPSPARRLRARRSRRPRCPGWRKETNPSHRSSGRRSRATRTS